MKRCVPYYQRNLEEKTLLVGTSDSVIRLGHQLRSFPQLGYEVIGTVATGKGEVRGWVSNVPILGAFEQLELILSSYHVEEILVPAGEVLGSQMRFLADTVENNSKKLRVIPRVEDLFTGNRKIPVRDVDIN